MTEETKSGCGAEIIDGESLDEADEDDDDDDYEDCDDTDEGQN